MAEPKFGADVVKVIAIAGIAGGVWWAMSGRSGKRKIGEGTSSDTSCDSPQIGSQSKNFEILNEKIQEYLTRKPEHEPANPLVVTDMYMRQMLPYCPPTPPADHPAAYVFREVATMAYSQMRQLGIQPLAYNSSTEMFSALPANLGY